MAATIKSCAICDAYGLTTTRANVIYIPRDIDRDGLTAPAYVPVCLECAAECEKHAKAIQE